MWFFADSNTYISFKICLARNTFMVRFPTYPDTTAKETLVRNPLSEPRGPKLAILSWRIKSSKSWRAMKLGLRRPEGRWKSSFSDTWRRGQTECRKRKSTNPSARGFISSQDTLSVIPWQCDTTITQIFVWIRMPRQIFAVKIRRRGKTFRQAIADMS